MSEVSQGEELQEDGAPAARNQSGLVPVSGISIRKHADLSMGGRPRAVICPRVTVALINYCTQHDIPLRKSHMTRGTLLRCPSPQRLWTHGAEWVTEWQAFLGVNFRLWISSYFIMNLLLLWLGCTNFLTTSVICFAPVPVFTSYVYLWYMLEASKEVGKNWECECQHIFVYKNLVGWWRKCHW